MGEASRNETCPCGSGKKYKRCCGAVEALVQLPAQARPGRTVPAVALEFLYRRHRRQVNEEIREGFFGSFEPEDLDALSELSTELLEQIEINAHDWLLAEGVLETESGGVEVPELLLRPGSPPWSSDERAWIEANGSSHIGLYEIVAIDYGRGVELRDVLDRRRRPLAVLDRLLSTSVIEGDLVGLRLVAEGGETRIAGSVYAFHRIDLTELVDGIRRAVRGLSRGSGGHASMIGRCVRDLWLLRAFETAPSRRRRPKLVDRSTGESLVFVTDHFDLLDKSALEAGLAGASDVEGDRDLGWSRFEALEGFPIEKHRRDVAHIELRGEGRLAVQARTIGRADAARAWLEALVGEAIRFRIREQADPWALVDQLPTRPGVPEATRPLEMTADVMSQVNQQIYRNWANEPVALLRHRTPRETASTPGGRRRIEELIRGYEVEEARRAREVGRVPLSFDFLRKQVGLPERGKPTGSA